MTPAINTAIKHKIVHTVHEFEHVASTASYGQEVVEKLSIGEQLVFKTLVVMLDNKELIINIIPVSSMLNMKLVAKAAGAKKASMADKSDVERVTGYVLGGVSPLGQKRRLRTFIDSTAKHYPKIYVSAGRRGLEMGLSPKDLQTLTRATLADICQSAA